ncbi:MAG: hypothetical protein HC941_25085 [Microcoleus sp. SU_5_3]|nr:hypothetical protein [Microcoleus sp. SU_5_3]
MAAHYLFFDLQCLDWLFAAASGRTGHYQLYLLTITSFGIAIGVLWEIAEWTAGIVLSTEVIESLDDMIIDLIMNSLLFLN